MLALPPPVRFELLRVWSRQNLASIQQYLLLPLPFPLQVYWPPSTLPPQASGAHSWLSHALSPSLLLKLTLNKYLLNKGTILINTKWGKKEVWLILEVWPTKIYSLTWAFQISHSQFFFSEALPLSKFQVKCTWNEYCPVLTVFFRTGVGGGSGRLFLPWTLICKQWWEEKCKPHNSPPQIVIFFGVPCLDLFHIDSLCNPQKIPKFLNRENF